MYRYIIIGVYLICGLIHMWGTLQQAAHRDNGGILPTELVASFLFWPIILLCQLAVAIVWQIETPEDDNEGDDNDDFLG